MKMYVKPSLEINKFEVEDIMSNSGLLTTALTEGSAAKAVYDQYVTDNPGKESVDAVVEFQW